MRTKRRFGDSESLISSQNMEFASTPNSELIEKKHQQIVDGACRVFFRKGYHPTTTRDIAKECGISIGQLYHYISSKDDVLFLVHQHQQRIWHQRLKDADIKEDDDPLTKFKKALFHSLEFMIEHKKLIQFIYSESKYLDHKHLSQVLQMDFDNVVSYWTNMLIELKNTYPIKGDEDFSGSVISYLLAFLALRGWTLDSKSNDQHIQELVNFILRGLGINA